MTIERKFALVRVEAGDYLLPSNDEQTIWRVARYWEDGSLEWTDTQGRTRQVIGWRWQIWRRPMPDRERDLPDDFFEWEDWTLAAGPFETRGDAIEDALSYRS